MLDLIKQLKTPWPIPSQSPTTDLGMFSSSFIFMLLLGLGVVENHHTLLQLQT
jgi:hypothetical protein